MKKWKAQRLVFPSTLDAPAREGKKNPTPPKTEFTILYGTASPPTSYGGYGGNAAEEAK